MNLEQVQDLEAFIIGSAAVIGVIAAGFRYFQKKFQAEVIEVIKAQTYQIQPGANGGKSLEDLHKKIDEMERKLDLHAAWHEGNAA